MIKKHPLKIFNVLSYQEREIKSTLRFHPTSNIMAKLRKQQTTNAGKDMGKWEHS